MSDANHLHYRYIIAFLVAAIIEVIALTQFQVPQLVDKVSFALTIASLVLAVVAIIYAFMVANRQDQQMAQLSLTSANIGTAANRIQDAAATIIGHANEIPLHLKGLESKLGSLSEDQRNKLSTTDIQEPLARNKKRLFIEIFIGSRYAIMAAIYLYVRSYRRSEPITHKIFESIRTPSFDVTLGVVCCLESFGLAKIRINKNELAPIECDDAVDKNIDDLMNRILADTGHEQCILRAMIERIDLKFDETAES